MGLHTLLSLLLTVQTVAPGARLMPWEHTVRWSITANSDTGPWESPVLDADGHEQFRVALIPLWAVEGGVTAFEIALSGAQDPKLNLLGERESRGDQAIVIDARDLERGIARSKFGSRRSFNVSTSGTRTLELTVVVLGARLGRGVGFCEKCPNVQELRARVAVRTR